MAAADTRLTELGRALGCDATPRERGLPESCYYAGAIADLGPAPAPRLRLAIEAPLTALDREAVELRRRGDDGLLRFFRQLAMRRRRVG